MVSPKLAMKTKHMIVLHSTVFNIKNVWQSFIFCMYAGWWKWYHLVFFQKMRRRKLYKSYINKFLLQNRKVKKVFQTFLLSFCLFLCSCFRSTEVCFSYCVSYSRVFQIEKLYIYSTRPLLSKYIVELNQYCVVLIYDSKHKSGARLLTPTVYWHC